MCSRGMYKVTHWGGMECRVGRLFSCPRCLYTYRQSNANALTKYNGWLCYRGRQHPIPSSKVCYTSQLFQGGTKAKYIPPFPRQKDKRSTVQALTNRSTKILYQYASIPIKLCPSCKEYTTSYLSFSNASLSTHSKEFLYSANLSPSDKCHDPIWSCQDAWCNLCSCQYR